MTATKPEAETFKKIEAEYDGIFKTEGIRDEDRAYAWHARNILKQAPQNPAVLDIACGAGYFLRELNRLSHSKSRLTGLDISSEALRLAQQECPQASYKKGVAEALPFEDGIFDAITCLGSLEHFVDIPGAIAEMKRVSKQSAAYYILVPNLFWYRDIFSVVRTGGRVSRNQTHERFLSLGEWKQILNDAGLEIKKNVKYNGIAKSPLKQAVKDIVIPLRFSYHFVFICGRK